MKGTICLKLEQNQQKKRYDYQKEAAVLHKAEADFELDFCEEEKDGAVFLRAELKALKDLTLKNFSFETAHAYKKEERIYCNGYQSWTDSREFLITEKMKGISKLINLFYPTCKAYGDYNFVKYDNVAGHVHAFSYTYFIEGDALQLLGSLSESSGYTIFRHRAPEKQLIIEKDVDGAVLKAGESYTLLSVVVLKGGYDAVFDRYFALLDLAAPKIKHSNGFTTWYNYYQNISKEIVEDCLNSFVEEGYKLDIYQIDDGHQSEIGDWLLTNKTKFPGGMKEMADLVKSKGMTPGIWLAPFACVKNSEVFKNHPEWLVRDESGAPVKAGGNWGGFYTLDFYNPEAAEYIRHFFDVILNEWGYELVKLDFLYQACILPRAGKSRGQIMCEAMDFIRSCVGDKLILGCGVPLFPAFGKVDYCRIGCDVGLNWDGTKLDRMLHRENVSTKRAIFTSIYRRHLDGRAFCNDPDVFLLRDDNIWLSRDQKFMLAKINRMFGNLLFTSDNVKTYDEEQKEIFKNNILPAVTKIKRVHNEQPFIITVEYTEEGKDRTMVLDLNEGRTLQNK